MAVAERLSARIEKPDGESGCWLYTGSGTRNGYGQIMVAGHMTTAHRAAWAEANGPIPEGLVVCHRCDVRRCVNPDHLFLGSPADNTQDMLRKHRHGAASKPESVPRGDQHHARLRPEHLARGERIGVAKLTAEAVRQIRDALSAGTPIRQIARRHQVDPASVRNVRDGRTWVHVR